MSTRIRGTRMDAVHQVQRRHAERLGARDTHVRTPV